jgi:hypothetical protein
MTRLSVAMYPWSGAPSLGTEVAIIRDRSFPASRVPLPEQNAPDDLATHFWSDTKTKTWPYTNSSARVFLFLDAL